MSFSTSVSVSLSEMPFSMGIKQEGENEKGLQGSNSHCSQKIKYLFFQRYFNSLHQCRCLQSCSVLLNKLVFVGVTPHQLWQEALLSQCGLVTSASSGKGATRLAAEDFVMLPTGTSVSKLYFGSALESSVHTDCPLTFRDCQQPQRAGLLWEDSEVFLGSNSVMGLWTQSLRNHHGNQQLIVNHVWLICCRHPVKFKWFSAIDARTPGLGGFGRQNSLCFWICFQAYIGCQDMKRLSLLWQARIPPIPLSAQAFRRVGQGITTIHKTGLSMLSRS